MTTKCVMRESKGDVCAWFSKAIFLHESLPEMCNERAPELLGGEGSTCASSAFLMSLSALLLRMGAGKFYSVCGQVCLRVLYSLAPPKVLEYTYPEHVYVVVV